MIRVSSNLYRKKSSGFNKRIAFDAALVIGILGFAISLWGIPNFIQFVFALGIGTVSAFISFFAIVRIGNSAGNMRSRVARFSSTELTENETIEGVSIYTEFNQNTENVDSSLMSIHTEANYEPDPNHKASGSKLKSVSQRRWSSYLIDNLEWRVFDRLCIAFWRIKGNKISGIAERTTDGIDFFISAATNKQFRIAVIQTRSSQAKTPSIDDIDNLIRLRENNNLSVAMLMYAGKLSNVVYSYCISNGVRLFDSESIAKGIKGLEEKDRHQLFKALIRPDYMVPSCPSCRIKLVRRQSVKTGRNFWGCVSFPKCSFTITR